MIFRLAFMVFAVLLSAAYGSALQARTMQAQIRWTTYGVPHVKAENYLGLGYGYGYASARSSACELADRITTLRGLRSGLFGPSGNALVGFARTTNLDSDLFYRVMLPQAAVRQAYEQLSANARELVDGYAAGFNRYVGEIAALPGASACGGIRVPEMRAADVVAAMMQIGTVWKATDVARFAASSTSENLTEEASSSRQQDQHAFVSPSETPSMASNAWVYGSDVTATGAAIVVANPHSFWQPHWLSMHEVHLTIPGMIDVYGADYLGLPLPVVGFTNNVAWSIEAPSTVTYHLLLALKIKAGLYPPTRLMAVLERSYSNRLNCPFAAMTARSPMKHSVFRILAGDRFTDSMRPPGAWQAGTRLPMRMKAMRRALTSSWRWPSRPTSKSLHGPSRCTGVLRVI